MQPLDASHKGMYFRTVTSWLIVFAASTTGYAAPTELTCIKNIEGVSGKVAKIVIDQTKNTVNGHAAQFTDKNIIFRENNAGLVTTYVIDRFSLQMTAQDEDTSKWSCSTAGQ
jgi:hypothetical protein